VPVCVHWHACDGCSVSTPQGSQDYQNTLSLSGLSAGSVAMSGGFDESGEDSCKARTAHGFYGIESCAVDQIAQCLLSIPIVPRLVFDDYLYPKFVPGGRPVRFSLRAAAEPQRGAGRLIFRLLDGSAVDSHGGRLTLRKNGLVKFFTPKVGQATTAKFAFEVSDHNGRVGIGVASINVTPASRLASKGKRRGRLSRSED
ncbi:hypothetical protein ACFL17_08800, partial [Pseudomonadota bacterium]